MQEITEVPDSLSLWRRYIPELRQTHVSAPGHIYDLLCNSTRVYAVNLRLHPIVDGSKTYKPYTGYLAKGRIYGHEGWHAIADPSLGQYRSALHLLPNRHIESFVHHRERNDALATLLLHWGVTDAPPAEVL